MFIGFLVHMRWKIGWYPFSGRPFIYGASYFVVVVVIVVVVVDNDVIGVGGGGGGGGDVDNDDDHNHDADDNNNKSNNMTTALSSARLMLLLSTPHQPPCHISYLRSIFLYFCCNVLPIGSSRFVTPYFSFSRSCFSRNSTVLTCLGKQTSASR